MKKTLIATAALIIVLASFGKQKPVEKILIAGSGWDSIAIINRATGTIEWAMELPEESECNSICMTNSNEILFSYKKGARVVDRNGNIVWDYKAAQGTELQTALQLKDGNYLVASCGTPMRIAELDQNGKTINQTAYDLGIEYPHSQFRVIAKSDNGNYLIPVISQAKVIEITPGGDSVRSYATLDCPFSLIELGNGNLLVSCGSTHSLIEIDRTTGQMHTIVSQNDIANLQFVATAARLANGNTMIANWLGYSKDGEQTQIIEFDANHKLVWSYQGRPDVKLISAIYPFTEVE